MDEIKHRAEFTKSQDRAEEYLRTRLEKCERERDEARTYLQEITSRATGGDYVYGALLAENRLLREALEKVDRDEIGCLDAVVEVLQLPVAAADVERVRGLEKVVEKLESWRGCDMPATSVDAALAELEE